MNLQAGARTVRESSIDYLVLGILCLFLVWRCFKMGGEIMNLDELGSLNLIHDPSVSHMLKALSDQADANPPVYYLVARIWAAIFSESALSLRMFSTGCFCVGFKLLWTALRPRFGWQATLLAFAVVLLPNNELANQMVNVRCYGLLFALVALTVWLGMKLSEAERPSWKLLIGNALAQAMLILTHPLAGFSSAAILFGIMLSDFFARPRRWRPWIAASFMIGWLALLLWWKQFLRQANVNAPSSWVLVPSWKDLLGEIYDETNLLYIAFVLVLVVFWFVQRRQPRPTGSTTTPPKLLVPGMIGIGLIGLAPLFYLISNLWPTNSIFLPRYLIPTTIGWMILLAVLTVSMIRETSFGNHRLLSWAAGIMTVIGVGVSISQAVEQRSNNPDGLYYRLYQTGVSDPWYGHPELPIVSPWANLVAPRWHYSEERSRYYYLLDWDAAISPMSPPGENVAYKIMTAFRKYGYETNIMEAADFFRAHPVFLLQDIPRYQNWCTVYLRNYTFQITPLQPNRPLGDHQGEWPLVLVEIKQ